MVAAIAPFDLARNRLSIAAVVGNKIHDDFA
jgi:hypothetical protein